MKVVFTGHFLKRLSERNLNKLQVREVILNPDKIVKEKPNRFRAMKFISKNNKPFLFIVIYDKINNKKVEVVTAFLTSKIKRYID
ncbi:MAG: DUF4258 domain-containing protein [Patescibacteria group bacterium]